MNWWSRKKRKLPQGKLQGMFYITEASLKDLERLLPTFQGTDGNHEGIAFLCGRQISSSTTVFTTAIVPQADHSYGHVRCSTQQIANVSKMARGLNLGVLAQIHSHPGESTQHSVGDDSMVLMPFNGMLSIIVPHYGHSSFQPLEKLGVHQFQNGRWTLIEPKSIFKNFIVLPNSLDLR